MFYIAPFNRGIVAESFWDYIATYVAKHGPGRQSVQTSG